MMPDPDDETLLQRRQRLAQEDAQSAAEDRDPYAAFDVARNQRLDPGYAILTKGEGAIGSGYQPLPVRGYKPQSSDNVNLVNAGKELEAALIAYLAKLASLDGTDKRMLDLAKSNVQQGCMWAWRAVFQPSED